jgi:serine protease AprX
MNAAPARRIVPAALAASTLVALTLVGANGSAAGKADTAAHKGAAAKSVKNVPLRADRDRDKIFDNLELRLAPLPATAERSVIVTLRSPATAARTAGLERAVGDFDVSRRFNVIDAFAATMTKAQIAELAANPAVARIEENSTVRALNDGSQSSFGVAKARTDAPSLDGDGDGNAATYSGRDLVAAVIDTGIDAGHQDLDEGKVIAFKDFVNGRTTPYDDNGHGTHVAGTIAGEGDARADRLYQGVAPAAALVGVKVLDANGGGTMANVTAAIDWVIQVKDVYGIEVVNLSLGAAGCSNGTDATSQAVNRAEAAGLIVAVAAGNEGPGTCTIGSPAAATGALTVGAMADLGAGGFGQAYFSSRGPTADGRVKPDVSAPGVDVTSAQTGTTAGYAANSGTSMATPFVAGVALLMRDWNAGLTPTQVRNAITGTAIDWGRGGDNRTAGSTGRDIDYGAGRLDAYAALAAVGAPLSAPPATPARRLIEGTLSGSGAIADYRIDVSDVGYPIAATLILPSVSGGTAWTPDFDLYLYSPAGTLVARAETVQRQENVTFRPTAAGTYTLRVRSYSGSGPYFVDASAGFGTAAPPPTTTTATAFPRSTVIYAGTLRSGDASRLRTDDNAYYQVNSTTSGTRVADWYATLPAVSNGLTSLNVTYRGRSSSTCTQVVYVYNWTTGAWVSLGSKSVGTTEVASTYTPAGTLADYVSGTSGDGDVAIRVRCTRSSGSYYVSGDLLSVTFTKTG